MTSASVGISISPRATATPSAVHAVGQVHRLVGVLGPDRLAAGLGVADRVDRQQRGLGLHVVHVGGVGDPGPLHRDLAPPSATFLTIADAADLLGQHRLAHREADGQPRLVGLLGLGRVDRREDRGVRADHAVGAAGPDDRDLLDLVGGRALGDQHLAERPVGDDPGVVVDAAVALGLADDRRPRGRRPCTPSSMSLASPQASATLWIGTLRTSIGIRHRCSPFVLGGRGDGRRRPCRSCLRWPSLDVRPGAVITARRPPCSTNRQAASTLGPIEPLAKWPSAAMPRICASVDRADRPRPRACRSRAPRGRRRWR